MRFQGVMISTRAILQPTCSDANDLPRGRQSSTKNSAEAMMPWGVHVHCWWERNWSWLDQRAIRDSAYLVKAFADQKITTTVQLVPSLLAGMLPEQGGSETCNSSLDASLRG